MFNLLMQYQPWAPGRDTVSPGRLFEHTDREITGQFRDGDNILLNKLIQLPCLFMREGIRDELAYVGAITRARISGNEIAIEYTFDLDIPPLLNSTIFGRKIEFDMGHDFEFSRTHWAVKDVDLYRVLLRNFKPRRQRPVVFDLPDNETIEPLLVSAMMPFHQGFTPIYESLKEASEAAGLRCRRADDIWENPAVIQDVVSLIDKSRVVICDCTGRNPNVFYEIGIAHTLGREVILITQADADIPFDLRHLRYVKYLDNVEGRQALRDALAVKLRSLAGN
jgi:hypothetical protein